MFGDNTTRRLLAIENEQRAQKASSTLNGGSLNIPNSAPQATWSGRVRNPGENDVAARWVATFRRTDGIRQPPLVDFPWNIDLDVWQYQDEIVAGITSSVSGRDKHAIDQKRFTEATYGVGEDYVSWSIDIVGAGMGGWFYYSGDGTIVRLTVQAISIVPGTLTLERII